MTEFNIENEIWKPCPMHEEKYLVSNCGNFKKITDNSILTKRINDKGYISITLNKKVKQAHRFVALAFIENLDNKPQVDHIDDDKTNNHVSNLRWVTQSENLLKRGKTKPSKKLNSEMVSAIRSFINNGVPQMRIAKMLGVGYKRINNISTGIRYTKTA